jgi:hypothetical protein
MNERDKRRSEMYFRVREYGNENAAALAAVAVTPGLLADIAGAIAALDDYGTRQISGAADSRRGHSLKQTARENLRDRLKAISQTANAVEYDTDGFAKDFAMPRKRSDQELLATAKVFAAKAQTVRQKFLDYGLETDFIDELEAEIRTFETSLTTTAVAGETQVTATAEIDEAVKKGAVAVRKLDVVVKNVFRQNPAKLAAWASASHVERTAQKAKPEGPEK